MTLTASPNHDADELGAGKRPSRRLASQSKTLTTSLDGVDPGKPYFSTDLGLFSSQTWRLGRSWEDNYQVAQLVRGWLTVWTVEAALLRVLPFSYGSGAWE
jgi:hypothetical protein